MLRVLAAGAMVLALTTTMPLAAPVIYTFAGEVDESNYSGIAVGETVTYTFMIDLELPGYHVRDNDTIIQPSDLGYFRVDYLSGSAVPDDLPNRYSIDFHAGGYGHIYGSNGDPTGYDIINISGAGHPSLWEVGGPWPIRGSNRIYSGHMTYEIRSNLELVSITEASPDAVPEPASMALFGLGLLGMGAIARRLKKRA